MTTRTGMMSAAATAMAMSTGGVVLANVARMTTCMQRAGLAASLLCDDDRRLARAIGDIGGAEGVRKRLAAGLTRVRMQVGARGGHVTASGTVAQAAAHADVTREPYVLVGDVAIVPVHGPLYAGWDWLSWAYGMTSYDDIAAAIELAAMDARVKTIMCDVDSPGGTHAGIGTVREAIAAAQAGGKTVIAMARETMCSAAYYAMLDADALWATPTALVGSIGSVAVIHDASQAYAEAGVKVIAITDETLKLAGACEVEQTPAMIAEIAAAVRQARDEFFAAVSAARGIPTQTLADWKGAACFGAVLETNGLVDRVLTFSEAMATLGESANVNAAVPANGSQDDPQTDAPAQGDGEDPAEDPTGDPMDIAKLTADELAKARPDLVAAIGAAAAKAAAPKAATIAELKAAFGEDPAFALECAEKGRTLVDAKAAYADVLAAKLAEANKRAAAKPSTGAVAGAVPFSPEGGGAPSDYMAAVRSIADEIQRDDKLERKTAMNRAYDVAARRHPELHARWLANQEPVRAPKEGAQN